MSNGLGAILSDYDERDYNIKDYIVGAAPSFGYPKEYTYDIIQPVLNQGKVYSCVAFAIATVKSYIDMKDSEDGAIFIGSTNFIYHNRTEEDYQGAGLQVRQALQHVKNEGVCIKSLYIGNDEYCSQNANGALITDEMRSNAINHRIYRYAKVDLDDEDSIKTSLIENGPMIAVIRATKVLEECNSNYVKFDNTGRIAAHAVVVLGYRETEQGLELRIQNSWGHEWGDRGTAWLSYDYPILELWTLVDKYLPPVSENKQIQFTIGSNKYLVNDTLYEMDCAPEVKKGVTYIPIRYLATALSCSIQYKQSQKYPNGLIYIYDYSAGELCFYPIEKKYSRNGIEYDMKEDIYNWNGRYMLPLRLISELLGFEVQYFQNSGNIIIERDY